MWAVLFLWNFVCGHSVRLTCSWIPRERFRACLCHSTRVLTSRGHFKFSTWVCLNHANQESHEGQLVITNSQERSFFSQPSVKVRTCRFPFLLSPAGWHWLFIPSYTLDTALWTLTLKGSPGRSPPGVVPSVSPVPCTSCSHRSRRSKASTFTPFWRAIISLPSCQVSNM